MKIIRKGFIIMNEVSSNSTIKQAAAYVPLFKKPLDMSNTEIIPDKIKPLTEPVDTSDWKIVDTSYEGYRAGYAKYFEPMGQFQLKDAQMTEVNQRIDAETRQILQDFYKGTTDKTTLKDQFQELAMRNFASNEKYTANVDGAGTSFMLHDKNVYRVMMETFYSEFRRTALDVAVKMNNAEGQQCVSGQNVQPNTWKYYNSDYYYMSENAISTATDGIKELANAWGYKEFTIPDYAKEQTWLYHNFNTALSNPFSASERYFKDPEQVPPEGFSWFYQEEPTSQPDGLLNFYITKTGDTSDEVPSISKIPAVTWAKYKSANGTIHTQTAHFAYNLSSSDLYSLASLLRFTDDSPQAKAANQFLNGLQVYKAGYFDPFPKSFILDYEA